MEAALVYARASYCKRRQVGCVIVKNDNPIAIGFNGTPSGEKNQCEDTTTGISLPSVIHAEDNALRKLYSSTESSQGADVFVTTAPCIRCAEKLVDARVSTVYYLDVYRSEEGLQYLEKHGVTVKQITLEEQE